MSRLGFTIAPGAITALSNMDDSRAYYTFSGDLGQMGTMEDFLRRMGFDVVKSNVYPGFPNTETGLSEYKRALKLIFDNRVDGWWNQERALLEHGIVTQAWFDQALGRTTK